MTDDRIRQQDSDNLKSLALAFRIVGGLCALCVNFAWFHVILGFSIIFGDPAGFTATNSANRPATDAAASAAVGTAAGGIFVIAGMIVLLMGYAMGFFGFRAAKAMDNRQHWNLCLGTSIAFLLFQPLGLVLGVLAIIVLNRPTVRELFT